MDKLDYGLIDADQHYYEPYDCFSRHIDPKFKDQAITIKKNSDGMGEIYQNGQLLNFLWFLPTDKMLPPGSLKELFGGHLEEGQTEPEFGIADFASKLQAVPADDVPEWITDRSTRLRTMDAQGVEAVIMLPTLGVCVEHQIRDNAEALYANIRSFNRWVQEDWGFGDDGRIFSPAMMSLVDRALAIEELDRLIAEGVKLINLRTGPVYGRSPADRYFDPFWAKVEEAGISVTFHSGDAGYGELVAAHWGEPPRPIVFVMSMFEQFISFIDRPISDTIAAFVLHNLFGRFPGIKVLSIESGSAWMPSLLRQMDHVWLLGNKSPLNLGGPLHEPPSEIVRRHVYVAPFVEEEPTDLIEAIGVDRIINGSDYPHPEGNSEPVDYVTKLKGLSDEDVRKIMRTNLGDVLGIT